MHHALLMAAIVLPMVVFFLNMVSLCNKASVYDLMSFLSYAISKSAANLCVHNPVYSLFECVCFSGRSLPGILGKLVAEGRRACEGPKINGYTVANRGLGCIRLEV